MSTSIGYNAPFHREETAKRDLSSVLSGRPQNSRKRSRIPTVKAFRCKAREHPRHQKLSGGAIISNAGSHRSLRPADDAPRRSFRVSLLPPLALSDAPRPMPPRCPTCYRARGVFCHHCNYISPFGRFPSRPRCENINTIVSQQNESGHSRRK